MDRLQNRKTTAYVFLAVLVLRIVTVIANYIQYAVNLNNPLIPDSLLRGIRDFSVFTAGCYLVAALLNIVFLATQKLFWPAVLFSILVLVGITVFAPQISTFFLNLSRH